MGRHCGYAQGVTVGWGISNVLGANGTTCTAFVVHHNRLPQFLAKLLRHNAAHNIRGPSGRKGDNQGHGFDRIVLSERCK